MAVTCLTLDDLIALNRQIAALARAGAPLERGLQSFAHETPGRLGQVAEQISERMAQGSSLPEATAQLPGVPPVYVAVVEAGLRAGRLPAALEGLAEVARRMSQLRCAAALAMAYPLAVLHTAYFLLLFFVTKIATALATSLEDGSSSVTPFFRWLSRLGQWLAPWWFVPPLAITALVIFWWWQTSRSLVLEPRMGSRWMGWMPLFGRLQHDSQRAVFTQTLGLLLENGQPLAESLVLAAQTAGGRRLGLAADQARRALQQGAPAAESLRRCGLPPLVCCAIVASAAKQELADTLRRLSDDYHRRAAYQAERIRLILPLLLTFGLAGTAVAVYALILFLPWTTLLRELAQPNGG